MNKKLQTKFPSELRFDLASRDWVVIATGRAKRPEMFKEEKRTEAKISKKDCPFCQISTQERPVAAYYKGRGIGVPEKWPSVKPYQWTTIIIPNKYPAFLPHPHLDEVVEGEFYKRLNAVGYHELIITVDHEKSLALLPESHIKEVIDAYQERFSELKRDDFVSYVSIFHNHGKEAGASQPHPHSQLITTPLLDIDLIQALANSERYFKKHKKCLYCEMTAWELKTRKRIVFENEEFVVLCPFASKTAFEMIISPKKHSAQFEEAKESQKEQLAEAFKKALGKLYRGLGNPAYNFYLHTAPCDGKDYSYYHWHWTILPKTNISAGFEMGTRIEISTIEPEKAAEYLRKQ